MPRIDFTPSLKPAQGNPSSITPWEFVDTAVVRKCPRIHPRLTLFLLLLLFTPSASATQIMSATVPDQFKNPWPADWEKEFQDRGQRVLQGMCAKEKASGLGGRTYFENEKRAYGFLIAHLLAGDAKTAIKELQKEDAQSKQWHSQTEGIDYYACFTIKHQMRKYFLFGDQLDPIYKKRMFDGAKAWTEKDPLHRPHPAFIKPGEGWGPDVKNSWVDVRNTENLFLMRVTSVYLMAEETQNEATRLKYKETILKYAAALYHVGMGEWDSENYHGHSIGPLLNLYDFAKDHQIKSAAKACLDYVCAIGAVKYFRGAFNGPTNRDYNHAQPFGGSAPCILWLYFGDTTRDNIAYESDEVHVLSSAYRPPMAVVQLARKQFDRPCEIFASKPAYSASTTYDLKSPANYLETQYFGRSFQLGSLVNGTTAGKTAINGFKIVLADDELGAVAVQGVPGSDPKFVGSAKYVEGKVSGENRIAQFGNTALWLVDVGESPWVWTFPKSVEVQMESDITFLKCDKSWIALHPINTSSILLDRERQESLTDGKNDAQWKDHQVLSAKGLGGKFCGVAIEIGELPEFKSFQDFKKSVLEKSKLDLRQLSDGRVDFASADNKTLSLQFMSTPNETKVWRNGKAHDLVDHAKFLYQSTDATNSPIEQAWLGGRLTVRAGKSEFSSTVTPNGLTEASR